jgi:AcrR family transcriptional regulator
MLQAMPPSHPRGAQTKPVRPELPREFIAVHKRRRIMDAVAELTAEQGYEATKIADIVRRAGVARKTLYDNFDGKEEVFLATFDAAAAEFLTRVKTACAGAEDGWSQRVEAALGAFLGFVAEHPSLARLCMVEALSATPAAAKRYDAVIQEAVEIARTAAPDDSGLPDTIEETLVGGVSWIVYQLVRRGEAERALDLLPELSEFFLAPYAR